VKIQFNKSRLLVKPLPSINLIFILFMFSAGSLLASPSGDKTVVRDVLSRLDKRIDRAFQESDVEYLKQILTKDFVYVHSGATPVQTKSDVLRNTQRSTDPWVRDGLNVHVYGNVATVAGFISLRFEPFEMLKFHSQRIYVKSADKWKLASQHVTFNFSEEDGLHADVLHYVYKKYWSKL
jgi:ketosteroid isomerase-like protein